jgi:hypothetical protein
MEDIIDIIVTETTNLITITSSGSDEVIDVNIIDNREDIVLNVTPSVVEININSLTGNFGVNWGQITGTLSNQTDLNTALGLKADLVGGKVPSSQLPSYVDDVVEVANFASLPATGETGKIYITLDTNFMYRWSGSTYIEIKDSSAVWGAITGTLSSQTDLQNALNAKFDDPTGDTTQYIAGDGSLVTFPIAGQAGTLVREVRNTTGATLTKGTIVYISGATGNKPTVSKAIATGDSTSAQTFGMLQANIANNANGYAVCTGDLSGLDTSALTEGQQLYLSGVTAGAYTTTKSVAPIHLVYIGVVTRSHPTLGQIEVKIQNGYELDEIHDVLITSKANNDGLFYESSTSLWKNKSIATVLGYSPEQPLTFSSPLSRATNAVSIPAATTSVNGYLTSADWTTFNNKQNALTNPVTGTGTTNTLPKFTGASTIGNSNISDSGSLITLGSNTTISSGALGIGATPVGSSSNLYVNTNITGGANWNSIYLLTNILSDVTSQARGFVTNIGTQAATFTLNNLNHYRAEQGIFRAGSTVTNQMGFIAVNSLIGATNNYGFYGDIPSGTNRWNLYMAGTANNYLAGNLLINTTTDAGFRLDVNGTARVQGLLTLTSNIQATSNAFNILGNGSTQYIKLNNSTGITSIGDNVGITFDFNNNTLLSMRSSSGGGNNRFLMVANAPSVLPSTPDASAVLQLYSTTAGFLPPRMTAAQRTAIASPATGLIVFQTDGVEGLWLRVSTGWVELTVV